MRLIVAVFVLGEDMEDMEDVLKLCLGLWWEVFWKERFVWNVDFVEILKNKVLKIFSEILVIFWLVYQEACVNRPVRRNTGCCGAICGVIAWQIAIFKFGTHWLRLKYSYFCLWLNCF